MPVVDYGGAEGVPFRSAGAKHRPVDPQALLAQLIQLNARARASTGIDSMFGVTKDGQLYLTPNFVGQVGYRAEINLANMLLHAVNASTQQAVTGVRLLGEAILLEQADGKHLENANKILAIEMRKALLAGYGQSVEKRKQVPSYPRANRLSGALRRAISQPDMAVGTANGINYINQDRLNTEARHWARINFGVQAAPGSKRAAARSPAPKKYDVLGAGQVGFTAKPRPPMYLPPGFWEFIGGRATGREQRVGRVTQADERDDLERKQDRLSRAAARRAERIGAATGKKPTAPAGAGQFETIKSGGQGSYYRRNLSRATSGTSAWGRDYGGYEKARTYTRRYQLGGKNPYAQATKKRTVTQVTRGIRKSRQRFQPTGRNARFPTAGVVASNFMDAGFRALATHADRVYANMANEIVNDSSNKAGQKAYKDLRVRYNAGLEIENLLGGGKVNNPQLRGN